MFRDAKIGDRVCGVAFGWGKISDVTHGLYPIKVSFGEGHTAGFTVEGKYYETDLNPTLFWDEVEIIPPPKPPAMMTQAEYLADPGKCPFCRSFNIHGDPIEILGDRAMQPVMCHDCTKSWTDIYQLVKFEEGTD